MIKYYSVKKAQEIVRNNAVLIGKVCASCQIPEAYLKAVLLSEIPEIDLFDSLADSVVALNWLRYSLFRSYNPEKHTKNPLRKFDSSTGYGQIFSRVAVEALLFARSRGIPAGECIRGELSPANPDDLRRIWFRLRHDKEFNLTCSALNLVFAAYQMTGRIGFGEYTPEEIKLIFSRYNGNVRHITAYGEKAYAYYLKTAGNTGGKTAVLAGEEETT